MRIVTRTLLACFWLLCFTLALRAGELQPFLQDDMVPRVKVAGTAGPDKVQSPGVATSAPPEVLYKHGQLTIQANHCSLFKILEAVHIQTGARIEAPAVTTDARVVAHIGPGDPLDVLADLLDRSGVDYIIVGGSTMTVRQIILMPLPAPAAATSAEPVPAQPPAVASDAPVAPDLPPAEEKQLPEANTKEVANEEKTAGPVTSAEDKVTNAAAQDSASAPASDAAAAPANEVAKTPGDNAATVPADAVGKATPTGDAAVASADAAATVPGDDAAAIAAVPNPADSTGNAPVQVADQDASPPPPPAPPDTLPIILPGVMTVDSPPETASSGSAGNEIVVHAGQPAAVASSPAATSTGTNSSSLGTNANQVASNAGESVSVPGIPPAILNEICQYFGGSCEQVEQSIRNAPAPQPVQVCQNIVINTLTQGARCAN
jgi:hypothetical protein